ncbi:MAG: hypothetical protein AAF597_09380 [Bacteroidota bacterium]
MDQQEEDWIRLGKDLRNYQPQGDPAADFAAFQQLQQAEEAPPKFWRFLLLGIGFLLLLITAGWLLTAGDDLQSPTIDHDAKVEEIQSVVAEQSNALPLELAQKAVGNSDEPIVQSRRSKDGSNNDISVIVATDVAEQNTSPNSSAQEITEDADEQLITREPIAVALLPAQPTDYQRLPLKVIPIASDYAVLVPAIAIPEVALVGVYAEEEVFHQTKRPVRISFGAGLSSHWRGDRFLSDTDQGGYLSIGFQKQIGQRFSLDGRVGYRGHNLNLEIIEDEKPWSHHEEKVNEIDDNGEEIEYTYLGIVDGYKGIEFSLLMQYRLSNKLTLQGGARYSLPSLSFRRTVHSSRDGDVTTEPTPYHFLANEQQLVKYFDYGGLLGGQYRITNLLSLEAQLHLGMVDLIDDEGERMNRFNHSSSLSLGLRYRLN